MKSNLCNKVKKKLYEINGYKLICSIMQNHKNLEFYIAGGFIRNTLLFENFTISDVDFFIKGEGFEDFKQELHQIGVVRETPFGSLRWYPSTDGNIYFDFVHFSEIKLGLSEPRNIDEALRQFDITINALSVNLDQNQFFNPVNGLEDLDNKLIKSIRFDFSDLPISKECCISSLTTLWFRIILYAFELDFKIDYHTWRWICENQFRLQYKNFFIQFFKPNASLIDNSLKKILDEYGEFIK